MGVYSKEAAQAAYENIVTLLNNNDEEGILEYPLSVEVRSGWTVPGQKLEPVEYRIILTTGGPAVEIRGDLDLEGAPATARLLHAEAFEDWQELCEADEEVLLEFASKFYYDD